MKIHRLTAFHVPILLKNPVRHASHERSANDTLIVRCVMSDGSTGWGEGLPRTYVTGESIDTAWELLLRSSLDDLRDQTFASACDVARHLHESSLLAPTRLTQNPVAVAGLTNSTTLRECFGNSVRCAMELAILDAACRSENLSFGDLIAQIVQASPWRFSVSASGLADSILESRPEVFYSGAVTSMSPRKQWLSALKMRLFAFRQVKVKVGAAGNQVARAIRFVLAHPAVTGAIIGFGKPEHVTQAVEAVTEQGSTMP